MLLLKDALELVPLYVRGQGFYCCYFTVLKRDEGLRQLLDLQDLNKFIANKKFRVVSLTSIFPLFKESD